MGQRPITPPFHIFTESQFMKKILISIVALQLLVLSLVPLSSCSRGPAPDVEEVYDRVVEVLEAAHEVNVLMFGAGLPVYERGDAEDELIQRYYGVTDNGQEFVTPYAKFATIAEMEAAIAEVYAEDYRTSLISTLFTGFVKDGISVSMPARYSEDESTLYQNKYVDPLVAGTRVYDYATMEITKGSHSTAIRVAIQSYRESEPGEWSTRYLSFVFENGNWYLNSPSC